MMNAECGIKENDMDELPEDGTGSRRHQRWEVGDVEVSLHPVIYFMME